MPITVTNLTCVYGAGTPFETTALRDVSVTVENGSFVGILGRTGCGKSTLIQIMAGLLTPTAGTVMLDGQDIHARRYDRSILRRKVGIVFQYPECQLFETTVEKDVAFGLKHSGLSAAEKQARVRWALETVGFSFEKVHDQPPMGLSGGEKRRVAIAGVLAAKPEYLILDEPIAGLDPLGRAAFLQLITELNRGGMTILMVSHNADCLGAYAQRLLVLEDGQLVRDGTPEGIYADLDWMRTHRLGVPQSRTAAALLKQGGLDIPQDIASYDALLAAVLRAKGGGRP